MKSFKSIIALSLSFSLLFSFLSVAIPSVSAQDTNIALQRGYRTGYSDGYMAGYRDAIDNAVKNYARHGDYAKADRAYNKDYGLIEDYRDGYQQGFESGYDTGFEKRSFDATIPITLKKRGVLTVNTDAEIKTTENNTIAETTTPSSEPISNQTDSQNISSTGIRNSPPTLSTRTTNVLPIPSDDSIIVIPAETELVIELADEITTEQSNQGDKFSARVVSPNEINGAIIEGRISKIQKPGRIKRKAEVMLSFDRIILSQNRWSNYNATLTEVLPIKGDNVKRVDIEGTVEGKSSVKEDSIKVGATTGTGTVIGAIAGGPVGAAVGAGVGAAFGVGAVVIDRGRHIRLQKNQQLRIKTAYETQIR